MMRRRDLFTRLVAITAAVTLAPAVKAEAAPVEPTSDLWFTESAIQHGDGPTGWYMENGERRFIIDGVEVETAIADARAEGYVRGWEVRDANAESKALRVMRA